MRLIVPLVVAAVIIPTDFARARDVLPVSSAAERMACGKGFARLYGDVTTKRWLIQRGTGRLPSETCKLVGEYSQAELKLIGHFETHAAECRITSNSIGEMKEHHKKTEVFQDRVCLDAKQWPEGHPVVSDFGDPAYERLRRELGR